MGFMNELERFRGWAAQLLTYTISHRLLVIRLCSPEGSGTDAFLMCYYCSSLPQRLKWNVEQLEIIDVSERLKLVIDRRAGVSICCGKVLMRDHFDLRAYLAVTPATPESDSQAEY